MYLEGPILLTLVTDPFRELLFRPRFIYSLIALLQFIQANLVNLSIVGADPGGEGGLDVIGILGVMTSPPPPHNHPTFWGIQKRNKEREKRYT